MAEVCILYSSISQPLGPVPLMGSKPNWLNWFDFDTYFLVNKWCVFWPANLYFACRWLVDVIFFNRKNRKGVYPRLDATLKCWLTPNCWSTLLFNVPKKWFWLANSMQSTHLLVKIHNISGTNLSEKFVNGTKVPKVENHWFTRLTEREPSIYTTKISTNHSN